MLLGKRTRQPIKRTTSMTGFTVDVSNVEDDNFVDQQPIISNPPLHNHEFSDGYDQRFLAMVSPRNPASISLSAFTKHLHDTTAAPFLRSCWLCNRRLAPGRDIYIYRGDTAFCSLECRENQMNQDERKEKLNINAIAASSKKEDHHVHASSTTAAADVATTSKGSKAERPVVAA